MIREKNLSFFSLFLYPTRTHFQKFITYLFVCFFRNHYSQHRAAIEAARHGKTGRLESFNTADTQSIVPADDICGLCER